MLNPPFASSGDIHITVAKILASIGQISLGHSKMLRHYPNKTKVIFFDLEYFVPLGDRGRKSPSGMTFSPVTLGHKVLGGTFQTFYPMLNELLPAHRVWEWGTGSERGVLQQILDLLKQEWRTIGSKNQGGSLMLCGIGISHSDVPTLLAKMVEYDLDTPERIYDLITGCRQIDLSTATYCQFSSSQGYFAYPKTKAELYQKYLTGRAMESGKSVWDLYETRNFAAIEARSTQEVEDSINIYKAMFDLKKRVSKGIERLKKLDKAQELERVALSLDTPSFGAASGQTNTGPVPMN
jgi:hypothetical protein